MKCLRFWRRFTANTSIKTPNMPSMPIARQYVDCVLFCGDVVTTLLTVGALLDVSDGGLCVEGALLCAESSPNTRPNEVAVVGLFANDT